MGERKYFSMTGKEISLLALIREEPEWAKTHINELETERKTDCMNFFRWFWNQPGTNAEQGYDKWLALQQRNSDYVSSGIDIEEHLKTCPHLKPQEQGE